MTTTSRAPRAGRTDERAQLVERVKRITARAKAERRPTSYREDEAIALLKGKIAQLDRRLGRRANPSTAVSAHPRRLAAETAAVRLRRLQRTRDLTIRNAAGHRRTLALGTARAIAEAARLRGLQGRR